MKKQPKKLVLAKETLFVLKDLALGRLAGGDTGTVAFCGITSPVFGGGPEDTCKDGG